ncbi:MAG: hypothetical protein DYG92_13635, partial [Leptolyngbya sp. PLA1]|nr:hypothetical protein [Leptolyngbya sp. PLA1]
VIVVDGFSPGDFQLNINLEEPCVGPCGSCAGAVGLPGSVPQTTSGTTFWRVDPAAIDFSLQTWTLSAVVQLSGSTFGNPSGFRRGGFNLSLVDDSGRWIHSEFGDTMADLRNDNNGTSDPTHAVTLDDGFHLLTLEAGPGGGKLYIDGTLRLTLALGTGAGSPGASFGESSILASAVRTDIGRVVLTPTPGTLALASVGLLVACRRKR